MSGKKFFGHPMGLSTLFATEFWERFSYYGMRGFFVLYLTATYMNGGFNLSEIEAYEIYGIFTALVYVTPILGGILADKVLGQRRAIYIGALLMGIGQFTMAASVHYAESPDLFTRQLFLFSGLGLLIMGNGFFKPNISTMVGGLYAPDDKNKDSGFTLFYMGINLGAFATNFVGGTLAEKVGWQWGFIAAGVGMIVSTIWFFIRETTINNDESEEAIGLAPNDDAKEKKKLVAGDWTNIAIYFIGSAVAIVAVVMAILKLPSSVITVASYTLGGGGILYLGYTIFKNTSGSMEWNRVGVIIALAVFNVIFWSGFEQAGTSFNTFAKDLTDRTVFGYEIPASWFQSANALFIIILAPVFSVMWSRLSNIGKNPRTPIKFAISLIFLSIGFFIMALGNEATGGGSNLVSPMWLIMVYLFHTVGELFMSPIGLSMITKLSPVKIVSVMMGLWMGSIALGNYLAAAMTKISKSFEFDTFYFIGVYAAVSALLAFAVSPILNKMMKGIH